MEVLVDGSIRADEGPDVVCQSSNNSELFSLQQIFQSVSVLTDHSDHLMILSEADKMCTNAILHICCYDSVHSRLRR